jgi:DnaK suppressor protein
MKNFSHFEEKLKTERETVINDLQGIGVVKDSREPDDWQAKPADLDTLRADSNEVADKIESYEGNNDIVHKLERQLTDIDAALSKIKNNSFGICEIGGEEIENDRLEANPAARTCKKHMNTK